MVGKIKAPRVSLLGGYEREFKNEGIVVSTNKKSLYCNFCNKEISGTQKSLVTQHTSTTLHQTNKSRCQKNQSQQIFIDNIASITDDSETFASELCDTLMASDVPLSKLRNLKLVEFLTKYTGRKIPSETKLRTKYVELIYNRTMLSIRNSIGENSIWVSIDETTDSDGRYIANLIVGKLDGEPSDCYLLDCIEMEKCDSTAICKVFNDAMLLLWPDGIKFNRVLLFVTDGARYMMKAGRSLKLLYPKMIHVNCLVHILHNVCETIRNQNAQLDKLISEAKKIFLKAPKRVEVLRRVAPNLPLPPKPVLTRWGSWLSAATYYSKNFDEFQNVVEALDETEAQSIKKAKKYLNSPKINQQLAYIDANFSFLPEIIEKLEARNWSLQDSLNKIDEVATMIYALDENETIAKRIHDLLNKNVGYQTLKAVVAVSSSGKIKESSDIVDVSFLSPNDFQKFKYAPISSVEVERSFSRYKAIYRDNRKRFLFENLKKYVVVNCNQNILK